MKVSKLECLPVHAGWRKNFVFVRVETDSGIVGWGEAYSQYDRDRAIAAQVEELGRYVVGRDPFQIRHILQVAFDDYAQRRGSLELYCATSGIEQALWDIIGKATRQPVYNLLGGPVRSRIRVYANGWSYKMREAGGLCPRRRGGARSRLHRDEVRSGAGGVENLYPEGPHQARRESHARHARRGRPGRRPSPRHPPAPGADARHRARQCAGGIRAVLARRAVPVRKYRGARGSAAGQSYSSGDGRGAAHAGGFPAGVPGARGRHHQSRRLQLRRHSRAHVYRRSRRSRIDRGVAAQLQFDDALAVGHGACRSLHAQFHHHRILPAVRGDRPAPVSEPAQARQRIHRAARGPRARPGGRRGRGASSQGKAIPGAEPSGRSKKKVRSRMERNDR